jgi:hypothetical protein
MSLYIGISYRLIQEIMDSEDFTRCYTDINDIKWHKLGKIGTLTELPKALYADANFLKGSVVHTMCGELTLKPTKQSIHIGDGMHVTDKYGSYINHSFDPNTKIVGNKVVAIKDIFKNDEITFNYNESEIDMCEPFMSDGIYVCGKDVEEKDK